MEIVIHGDKIKVTESMSDYINKKMEKLEKYLKNNDEIRANVIVRVRNNNQIVEITIPLKSFILRSEESKEDFYAAVDKAIEKLERQIRKNKTRLTTKKLKNVYEFDFSDITIEEDEDTDKKNILKRKKIEIKPMDEEEAILQMELLGHQFYVYKDSNSDKVCVVYKRKDGNYGVIETK